MKKLSLIFLMLSLLMFIFGCVGNEKKFDPNTLQCPDKKAIYDLMVERCNAINSLDMNRFIRIYTKDSPELKWIEEEGIPMWKEYGVIFSVYSLKKITIVGNDGAANFILHGSNSYGYKGYTYQKNVEALYIKEGSQWQIESTGERF